MINVWSWQLSQFFNRQDIQNTKTKAIFNRTENSDFILHFCSHLPLYDFSPADICGLIFDSEYE